MIRKYSGDKKSIEAVRELLGSRGVAKPVGFCPDVAFALEAADGGTATIEPPLEPTSPRTLIGLNVSGLLLMGGSTRENMFRLRCDYKALVLRLIDSFLALPGTELLLVPHTFGASQQSDQRACLEIRELDRPAAGDS